MDIFVDRDGVVMVRDCGCPRHGPNSLWDDHDDDWKQNQKDRAAAAVSSQRSQRHLRDGGRFDKAERTIRATATKGDATNVVRDGTLS